MIVGILVIAAKRREVFSSSFLVIHIVYMSQLIIMFENMHIFNAEMFGAKL